MSIHYDNIPQNMHELQDLSTGRWVESSKINSQEPEFKPIQIQKTLFFLVNRSTENNSIWDINIKNHVKVKL